MHVKTHHATYLNNSNMFSIHVHENIHNKEICLVICLVTQTLFTFSVYSCEVKLNKCRSVPVSYYNTLCKIDSVIRPIVLQN